MSHKPELSIVELHPDRKPQVSNLYTRLVAVIEDQLAVPNRDIITKAEIIGTIEMLKQRYMK